MSVGEAKKLTPAGQTEQLQVGSSLMAGDRIRTGADGIVIMVFSDEGRISLRADSELLIRYYEIDPKGVKTHIELELVKGTIRQISGNGSRAQPERYRLNTPVAVIGVRGTDFLAKSDGNVVEAFVHEGKIVLTPATERCAQSACAPVAIASSDNNLKYVRLSTNGLVEQREFRQGELERIFGIDIARSSNPVQGRVASLASSPARLIEGSEAHLPEGTRTVTSTIFAANTKAEAQIRAHNTKPGPLLPVVPVSENILAIDMPKPIVWGRFSTASALPQQMLVPYAEASQGRHVTVGELFEYALWRANPSGAMSSDLRGQADFRLVDAEAVLVQNSGISTAKVTAATLGVDFDNALFKATVGMQHATAGAASINVSGKINIEGVFVGTNATDRVAGALTRDGTEAGYLFNKDVAAGTFRGITLWKR
jgi:hypothetical protein